MAARESFLRSALSKYQYPDLAKSCIMNTFQNFTDLRPKVDTFEFIDGSKELLCLEGTIPATYKGNTYNIPVSVWLMESFPVIPPMVFVKPTSTMKIKPGLHVDANGRIYIRYLDEWHHYQNQYVTRKDIFGAIQNYTDLRPTLDTFVFEDASRKELLCLQGTIPATYKGKTYNIPVCIWLMDSYPDLAPLVFVKPTQYMVIKPGRHVGNNGRVYMPYIHDWKHPKSDLLNMINMLVSTFGDDPPVFNKTSSPDRLPGNPGLTSNAGMVALPTVTSGRQPPAAQVKMSLAKDGQCEFSQLSRRYVKTLGIKEHFVDVKYDMCYCPDCSTSRGDKPTYARGIPSRDYAVPLGWFRLGLAVPPRAKGLDAFKTWHRAFHGTSEEVIPKILKVGDLLMPGDAAFEEIAIKVKEGHYNESYGPKGFDFNKVFVSPSIRYAGHSAYAWPSSYTDQVTGRKYSCKVALQLLIEPQSYDVGPETIGASNRGEKVDPHFDNNLLEWSTKKRACIILYGLLIKLVEE